jgi:hypothetical protein
LVWAVVEYGVDKIPIGTKNSWVWDYPNETGENLSIHGDVYDLLNKPQYSWRWDVEKRKQDFFFNSNLDNYGEGWINDEWGGGVITRYSSSFLAHSTDAVGNWAWSAYLQGWSHQVLKIKKKLPDLSISEINHLNTTIRWRRMMDALKSDVSKTANARVLVEWWVFNPADIMSESYPILEVGILLCPWRSNSGESNFTPTAEDAYYDSSSIWKFHVVTLHLDDSGLNTWKEDVFDFLPYIKEALDHWNMEYDKYYICRKTVGVETNYAEYKAEIDTIKCEVD